MLDKGDCACKPAWPRLPCGHGEMVPSRSSNHSLYGPFLPAGGPGRNAKNPEPPPTMKQTLRYRDLQMRKWAQRGHATSQRHRGMEPDASSGPRSLRLIWCLLDRPPEDSRRIGAAPFHGPQAGSSISCWRRSVHKPVPCAPRPRPCQDSRLFPGCPAPAHL